MYTYSTLKTPVGPMLIISSDRGVCEIHLWADNAEAVLQRFQEQHPADSIQADEAKNRPVIDELNRYFSGELHNFNVTMDVTSTPFQQSVWNALSRIPYGETRSYGTIARQLGKSGAARAVGMANRNNPLPILIPCHRVIGADGSMTGYAGKDGLQTKQWLIDFEKEQLRKVHQSS